jgi:hypothetical protein
LGEIFRVGLAGIRDEVAGLREDQQRSREGMTMGKGKVKTEPIEVDLGDEEGFGEPIEGLLGTTGGAEEDTVG